MAHMMLTPEDVKSLEAAKNAGGRGTSSRGTLQFQISDSLRASFKLAGLDEEEIELCEAWAGLGTPAGVSDECRYAHSVLDKVPLPPKPDVLNRGVLDKQQFWDQMGLAEHLDFFWGASRFQEQSPEPRTALGQVALKVIRHWRGFAEANWPTAADLYSALKRKNSQATKRRRLESTETKVGLAAVWRMALHLELAWNGRGHRSSINPEDIYEALGDLQGQVEVNCWARDDETMLDLLKKSGPGDGCSFCDVYSLDTFEFGWGSAFGGSGYSITSCPRCSGRLLDRLVDKTPENSQASKWDNGPIPPEKGDFAYRWAVKHGMMWDEFLEKVRGRPAGFDPSKKTLCPLLDQCNTRCAQDQKAGVRGWPLGSSDYETSCYKFREIAWCRDTGGTPEQFQTVERARHDAQSKAWKNKARRERQPKSAAVPLAQEQSLFPEDQRPAPPPAPRPVATPPTRRATRGAPSTPGVERPRMF